MSPASVLLEWFAGLPLAHQLTLVVIGLLLIWLGLMFAQERRR